MAGKERKEENWYSWVVCVSAFISNSLVFGFHSSYGSIFVAITSEMGITETVAAWIGSIAFGLVFLSASLSSLLCHRYGCRSVMLFGTLLYSIGLISSTFVVAPQLLFLTYSITIGFGSSCVHFSCLLILRSHFSNKLSLASGIVASGSGIGGLAINPIMGKLLETYGLQKSLLIYSSTSVVLYITGVLFKESNKVTLLERVRKRSLGRPTEEKKPKIKEPSLLCNGALVLLTVCHSLICFGFYIPQVHLIRLALLKGVPYSKATMLPGYIAAAQAVGKIIFGKVSDWPRINRLIACQLCLLMTTVANSLAPVSLSYSPLTAYAFCWGFFDGAYNILVIFLTGDLAGRHRTHAAYGFASTISSVFMFLGPPVAGFIHASTGSYETVFFLSGGNITLAICMMFLIPWLIPKYVTERKPIVASVSDLDKLSTRKSLEAGVGEATGLVSNSLDIPESDNNRNYSSSVSSIYSYVSREACRLLPSSSQRNACANLTRDSRIAANKSLLAETPYPTHLATSHVKFTYGTQHESCNSNFGHRISGDLTSVPSSWSVSSLWTSQSDGGTHTGSGTTNSDSGIYLSTKKDSIVILGPNRVHTAVCQYRKEKDVNETWTSSKMRHIPYHVGSIFRSVINKKSLFERGTNRSSVSSNESQEVVVDRITCL